MKKFELYAANENHPKWKQMCARENSLYVKVNDARSEFYRDYTRVIHSTAYRRLKHKTQVFFSPENDHICTRIEHVTHVESISHIIASHFGLNTELTQAIAVSHDLGHSPFGHAGEHVLTSIGKEDLGYSFWHEKNGLYLVDKIELLENSNGFLQNLNLTYAVRDGIISHCGEIDENSIKPREDFIDLELYSYPNEYAPYTWEGCVVKISDKISYICRDIEDAITLGILEEHLEELYEVLGLDSSRKINNTVIIDYLIHDLCVNSSPEVGLCFSEEALNLLNRIKSFNYEHIYASKRLKPSIRYFNLVLHEIYDLLKSTYTDGGFMEVLERLSPTYPKLINGFIGFLYLYYDSGNRNQLKLENKILYSFDQPTDFYQAILSYISGMTDNFAIEVYQEIIGF